MRGSRTVSTIAISKEWLDLALDTGTLSVLRQCHQKARCKVAGTIKVDHAQPKHVSSDFPSDLVSSKRRCQGRYLPTKATGDREDCSNCSAVVHAPVQESVNTTGSDPGCMWVW